MQLFLKYFVLGEEPLCPAEAGRLPKEAPVLGGKPLCRFAASPPRGRKFMLFS
jgi:hypothetical protein